MRLVRRRAVARSEGEIRQCRLIRTGLPNLAVGGERQTARNHVPEGVSHPDGQIWIESLHHLPSKHP